MRTYQVSGLNWMIALHDLGLSGILADEMSKQIFISFALCHPYIRSIPFQQKYSFVRRSWQNITDNFSNWLPKISSKSRR